MAETRRKMRRVHHEEVGMQIAPMVDVVLLLLFFFMLSGKLTKQAKMMDIKVPHALTAVIPTESQLGDRDIINIDGAGNFFIGNVPATSQELTTHLKERFKNYPPLKLYIRADANAAGKKVKEVMHIASDAGAVEVIFGVLKK